jgi:hypothetical protein
MTRLKVSYSSLIAALVTAALWGCNALAGVLLGEHRPTRMGFNVAEVDQEIVFTAEHPFGAISCVVLPEDRRRVAYDPPPLVWAARCPEGQDCVTSVRYASALLETTAGPEKLTPGKCYQCGVRGRGGWGEVEFALDGDKRIMQPCPRLTPAVRE